MRVLEQNSRGHTAPTESFTLTQGTANVQEKTMTPLCGTKPEGWRIHMRQRGGTKRAHIKLRNGHLSLALLGAQEWVMAT